LDSGYKGKNNATGIQIFFPYFSRDNGNLTFFKVINVADVFV